MQYDNQLVNLKTILPSAKKILIAIPGGANVDQLAGSLSLYLSLVAQGKEVLVVCEDDIVVGQSHIFAIDKVQKSIPSSGGGNFVITLEGVAVPNAQGGSVPSLDKLDYFVEGNNLNLVFKVNPGQSFQPAKITPRYQNGSYDVIITVGASTLNHLGTIYSNNAQTFGSSHIVNIDNSQANTNFGHTNVVDPLSSSVCEIIASIMGSLNLVQDNDIATNLLSGIFDNTANLTAVNTTAATYEVVSNLMKAGGQKPQAGGFNVNPIGFQSQPQPQVTASPVMPSVNFQAPANQPQYDLSALIPNNSPVANNTPSQEERPAGEGVITEAEPDWLTPKIFKGGSLG